MSQQSKLDLTALDVNRNRTAKNYWNSRLDGLDYVTLFDGDKMPNESVDTIESVSSEASSDLQANLSKIAPSAKAQHIVLISALSVLIQKMTLAEDVIVFTPLYDIDVQETAVGSIIPIRFDHYSGASFIEFLGAAKSNVIKDFNHGNYPIDKIVGAKDEDELKALPTIGMKLKGSQDKFNFDSLNCEMVFTFEVSENLSLTIDYDHQKFGTALVERISELYWLLFEKLFAESMVKIEEIEFVSSSEKNKILNEFNATALDFPKDKTLIDLFVEQVLKTENNEAVQYLNTCINYKELDKKSNQVANYLVDRFPEKGTVIGVQLDRSIELIVAVYGILKAGHVYLPLSKEYPIDRTVFTLSNSDAKLVFTDENEEQNGFSGFDIVNINNIDSKNESFVSRAKPEDLAYIIYTSGSTGKPKGVLIKHRSIVNRLNWMQNEYQLQYDDVILQKTPIVFDVSVWELFWWSMYGAKLVLAEPGAEKSPEELCQVIQNNNVSVMHFVPSMLNLFMGYVSSNKEANPLTTLRHLFASGEELKVKEASQLLKHCTNASLHNLYGPTEATVDVSYHEVSRSRNYRTIPIGKPIDNTTLLIVSSHFKIQPIGVPGELLIGGENLSLGYLNRPELTKEKFIQSLLNENERMYRSGDLAKWLPDGSIEFLGRIDNQVKVRGNRIELGEIEHCIKEFNGIENAVVLTNEVNEVTQIIGYIKTNDEIDEDALFTHVTNSLPSYMVPFFFIEVDEIRLTVNGKVDRKYLLGLERKSKKKFVAPSTPQQVALSAQWQEILGISEISIDDSFFRIGGDSILAVRLAGLINSQTELSVAMIDLYENDTIEKLAAFIENLDCSEVSDLMDRIDVEIKAFSDDYLTRFSNDEIELVYPMSGIEKGMCFVHKANPGDVIFYEQIMQPISYENFDQKTLQEALDLMTQKHEILRTGFDFDHFAHIIRKDVDSAIDYRDLSEFEIEEQKKIIASDLEKSRLIHFDLTEEKLWRIIVYKLNDLHHEMLYEYHHAIFDGWSVASFTTELNNTYMELRKGHDVDMKPLLCSYEDYIKQEIANKQNDDTKKYWVNELDGFQKLDLNVNSGEKVFRSVRHVYPDDMFTSVKQAAENHSTSVKTILLTAYVYALKILSGQNDVMTGLITFTRPLKEDGDKILGCFLNEVPFRVKFADEITWGELVKVIDAKFIEVKKHDQLSLADINKAINITTHEGNLIFDTAFNFINWHVMNDMEVQNASDEDIDRLEFDSFLRGNELFNANYNVNDARILCMHEYVTPFMNQEKYRQYDQLFLHAISRLELQQDKLIERESAFWTVLEKKASATISDYAEGRSESLEPISVPESFTKTKDSEFKKSKNVFLEITVKGDVDQNLIEKSIIETIKNHEALSLQFHEENGMLVQKINSEVTLNIQPGENVINDLTEYIFGLNESLVRVQLLKEIDEVLKIQIVFHRSIVDAYSVDQLAQEICDRIQSNEESTDITTSSFSAFSEWQSNEILSLKSIASAYWKGIVDDDRKVLELPHNSIADKNRYEGGSFQFELSTKLHESLTEYSNRSNINTKYILLAVYNILLHRYSSQDHVLVGVRDMNRAHAEFNNLVGPVSNILPLLSTLDSTDIFEDYTRKLKEKQEENELYASFPLELLGSEELSNAIKAAYTFKTRTSRSQDSEKINFDIQHSNSGFSEYELDLFLTQEGDGVCGELIYNANLFSSSFIENLESSFVELLVNVLDHPSKKISTLEMVNQEHKEHLLNHFNSTDVDYPKGKTLVDLFTEQAKRTPNGIAVKFENQELTYKQLDEQSTKLGYLLREKGIKPDDVVALCIDRTIDTIVGMIGILKSGGAYLPIDINYPVERINYIIEDSKTPLIVTTKEIASGVEYPIEIVCLEAIESVELDLIELPSVNQASNLCYVIYTSGTTGNPKGVMVEHEHVVRLMINDAFQFDFGTNDVWTMFHNHCFDVSVWEIYGALLYGGKLVVISNDVVKDPQVYLQLLKDEKVSIINQTPSSFYNLAEYHLNNPCDLDVRSVILAGEALNPGKLKAWNNAYPAIDIINMYGITETTVFVTYKQISDHEIEHNISNIGREIPTISMYVFDQNQKLVPEGVIGELYLGGTGVTRGYLGNQVLTDEKFILNLYLPEERLYRSGDLVRILSNGDLEYLGRIDDQVQLRGYRIELGEIENCLSDHPMVSQASILVKGEEENMTIVAYYVADTAIDIGILQKYMFERMPDYMVPSNFIYLDKLPRTSNGKIDTKSLLEIDIINDEDQVLPTTEVEKGLAEIWAKVLKTDKSKIGITKSFFEIGGNSLLIITLIANIYKDFNVQLSIADFFEKPTIKQLSDFIEVQRWLSESASEEKINKTEITI